MLIFVRSCFGWPGPPQAATRPTKARTHEDRRKSITSTIAQSNYSVKRRPHYKFRGLYLQKRTLTCSVGIDADNRCLQHAPCRVDVDRQVVASNAVETLGDRSSTSGNVSGDACIGEWIVRMNVAIEREIDVAARELGKKLRRFVSVGERTIAYTDRIDGRDVHDDRVHTALPLASHPSSQS